MQPPDYAFDSDRLGALASYAILDTPAEPVFDGIVQLASQICETPVALVSLVAEDRQWFKARIGFADCETDLNRSVCAHALVEPDLLVIPDLTRDDRSKANPLVTGAPRIRFYAGAPFHATSGEVLGSLCVIDTTARPGGLTERQAEGLRNLARQVTALLEMRRAIVERDALAVKQREAEGRRLAILRLGDRLREMTTSADMTNAAASIIGQTLNVSRVSFNQIDKSGNYLAAEPDWVAGKERDTGNQNFFGNHPNVLKLILFSEHATIQDVSTDPRTRNSAATLLSLGIASLVTTPVCEHGRTVAILIVYDQHPHTWSSETVIFLRNVADRLVVGITRLKAEAEQRILTNELSHRLKNTFALIQAIATQTLRSVPNQEPVEIFVHRLHALSAAHDVLLSQQWSSSDIYDIINKVVGTLIKMDRFDISGPNIHIGPRSTLSLSLLLHEMTTNAMKYGALSEYDGRVILAWRVDCSSGESELALAWCETGGPPVKQPNRKGFGSKLIRMGLVGTGGVELRYAPLGLEAEFRAPLVQVQLS